MSNQVASKGKIFICGACGKLSLTKYGFTEKNKDVSEEWWDESCMLYAYMVDIKDLDEEGQKRAKTLDKLRKFC